MALYAADTWTLTKANVRRLEVFEMSICEKLKTDSDGVIECHFKNLPYSRILEKDEDPPMLQDSQMWKLLDKLLLIKYNQN